MCEVRDDLGLACRSDFEDDLDLLVERIAIPLNFVHGLALDGARLGQNIRKKIRGNGTAEPANAVAGGDIEGADGVGIGWMDRIPWKWRVPDVSGVSHLKVAAGRCVGRVVLTCGV